MSSITLNLQELQNIDMPALVSRFVDLERCGDVYRALCPFHNDKATKSFVVYPTAAHCFGCNGHWDAIQFVEKELNVDFAAAVQWLQQNLPTIKLIRLARQSSSQYEPISPIPQMVLIYWQQLLNDKGRDYFYSRLFTNETIETYLLGWDGTAYVLPVWEGQPQESDVYTVRFRKAPESDTPGPKYWGIKGRNQPKLFNGHTLAGAKEAFVFIGEFDALLAWQDGLNAVSTTAGQNTWLTNWTNKFKDVERIWVVPDKGEETAGFSIASNFLGRAKVRSFAGSGAKDYTEYRQQGHTVQDFLDNIIGD